MCRRHTSERADDNAAHTQASRQNHFGKPPLTECALAILLAKVNWRKPSLKVLVEQGDGAHSVEKLLEEITLVRGVDGVPFEAEAH